MADDPALPPIAREGEPFEQQSEMQFDPPKGSLSKHYAAIGRLICAFSQIEVALNAAMRAFLNLPEKVGRSITGEMRAADLMSTITRITTALDLADDRMKVKEQLFGEINRLKIIRDDIAHRIFYVHGDQMVFTNTLTYRTADRREFNLYTVQDLNVLAEYAGRLATRVNALRTPPRKPARIPDEAWERSRAALHEIPPQLRPGGRRDELGLVLNHDHASPNHRRGNLDFVG